MSERKLSRLDSDALSRVSSTRESLVRQLREVDQWIANLRSDASAPDLSVKSSDIPISAEEDSRQPIIQITRPEVQALINERLRTGEFIDAEDVVLCALQSSPSPTSQPSGRPTKDIVELFAPLRGLNLDFGRNPSTGRPVDL